MKFLIFNLMVLSCLGYLIMSGPNENFVQWATKTKEKVSNLSREDFSEKIQNALKFKNNENNEQAKNNHNLQLKYNNELIKMIKKELSQFDKKLINALEKIPAKENVILKKNNQNFHNLIINDNQIKSDKIKKSSSFEKDLDNKKIFMSDAERSDALAELITDIELSKFNN